MAEKRYYKMTGKDGKGNTFTAYYAGHGLDKIRIDAAKEAGVFPSDISHRTMQGDEFYQELEKTENSSTVKPGRVRGVGQRWVVAQENDEDDSNPFGKAPGEPEGDAVGLELPVDEPSEEEEMEFYRQMESQLNDPPYSLEEIATQLYRRRCPDAAKDYDAEIEAGEYIEDEHGIKYSTSYVLGGYVEDEKRRQMAIGGFYVPKDSVPTSPVEEDKYKTGELEVPSEAEQKAELDELQKDPSTYNPRPDIKESQTYVQI